MENIVTEVQGDTLILKINTKATGTLSGSGKSMVIASTRGNTPVALPDGSVLTIGLNAYTRVAK